MAMGMFKEPRVGVREKMERIAARLGIARSELWMMTMGEFLARKAEREPGR